MTMSNEYETGNSSVEISDGAKGSTVKVKVYARAVPEDENTARAIKRLLSAEEYDHPDDVKADAEIVVDYIKRLRAAVPDLEAAQNLANQLHLKTAAAVQSNGGIIVYDPEQKLLAAWVTQERDDPANA